MNLSLFVRLQSQVVRKLAIMNKEKKRSFNC